MRRPRRASHEELEQVELTHGEREGLAVDGGLAPVRPESEVLDGERLALGHVRRSPRTPERCTRAAHQLHHAKRLRKVVVGATVECAHLVELGILRGEHHHRDARKTGHVAHTSKDVEAIGIRKHDVEENDVGSPLGTHAPELRVVVATRSIKPRLAQRINRKLTDVLVILDVVHHARDRRRLPWHSLRPSLL